MKRILQYSALLSTSFLISIVISELVIRLIAPQQLIIPTAELYQPDSLCGFRHRSSLNTIVNTGELPVHFRSDKNGYRINGDAVEPSEQSAADFTILFIGDSFVEALAVENDNTFSSMIPQGLSEKHGIECRGINAGISKWSPNNYYMEVKRALAAEPIDLGLVFLYIGNDLIRRIDTSFVDTPSAQQPKRSFKSRIMRKLFELRERGRIKLYQHSHLYVLFKNRLPFLLNKMGLISADIRIQFWKSERDAPRWETVTHLCQFIQKEFARYDVPILFVFLPTNYQVLEDSFLNQVGYFDSRKDQIDLEQPNKILAELFESHALTYVDPLYYLRDRTDAGLMLWGEVDKHFNGNGHQVLAEFLTPYIEPYIIEAFPDE